jgi:ankyrin repeat protein
VDQLLFGVTDLGVIAAENDDHQTALGIAATKGDLLTAGALLDAIEKVAQSGLDLKLQKPLFEFLKLRPSSKMNADDLSDIVQRLVRIQPNTLYTYDEEGYPPYCRAVKDGNAVVARCLKRCIVSAFGEDEKSARKALYGEKSTSHGYQARNAC